MNADEMLIFDPSPASFSTIIQLLDDIKYESLFWFQMLETLRQYSPFWVEQRSLLVGKKNQRYQIGAISKEFEK